MFYIKLRNNTKIRYFLIKMLNWYGILINIKRLKLKKKNFVAIKFRINFLNKNSIQKTKKKKKMGNEEVCIKLI